jgi:RimJ/RimL family protein N-acetyltransferase
MKRSMIVPVRSHSLHDPLAGADTVAPADARRDIATHGILCCGDVVEIGWPDEDEFDRLTTLRNRSHVRTGFLDPRPLDPAANRVWLRSGMRRPVDALLAMRLCATGALCGMIGWTGWTSTSRTLELGRIVVDRDLVRRARHPRWRSPEGIAVDAAKALCDYLFAIAGARALRSTYIIANRHAARVNRLAGGRIVGTASVPCADGTFADVAKVELTRDDWLRFRSARP